MMTTLKDLFRIGLIMLVISFFLIPMRFKKTINNLHLIQQV